MLSLLAIGFTVAMTTSVEGQLFRRGNCCGCQNMSYSAPTVRYFQPRIMNYTQPAVVNYGQPAQVYSTPTNCGCNGGAVMGSSVVGTPIMGGSVLGNSVMSGSVMGSPIMNGSVMSGTPVQGSGNSVVYGNNAVESSNWGSGEPLVVTPTDQSCLSARTSCYTACDSSCGPAGSAQHQQCRAHCQCIYTQCDACKKGNPPPSCGGSPRAACQAIQPNPCATIGAPGQ